jgi:hypothetical protein
LASSISLAMMRTITPGGGQHDGLVELATIDIGALQHALAQNASCAITQHQTHTEACRRWLHRAIDAQLGRGVDHEQRALEALLHARRQLRR